MKRKFDYALVVIEYLKKNPEKFMHIGGIAEEFHLPRAYLEKVVQELKHAGWLEARKGASGGYRLARDPATVSVETLINFYEPIYSFCPLLRTLKK